MTRPTSDQIAYLALFDPDASYRLAKRMERFKSNSVLGYRTAGSRAEFETGEMLLEEMRAIGLSDLRKDPFPVDGWEFRKARMQFTDDEDGEHYCELGGYQTNFHTNGWKRFAVVDAGRCTEAELSRLDVRGKLVLADINQRDDWWISYPVYQAYLHGAAAVIAVQQNGYGEVDSAALNAQNICGPADAPAFSLSRRDARALRAQMEDGEISVLFDAHSTVTPGQTSYNIVGSIPGADPDSMILVSAHYDSYFSGFQDDNAAVALMLGIARALAASGIKPRHTVVFCAMAAEEWGTANSKYDWSTGAYSQIFRVHPEWAGKIIADLNFELPAYAHDTQDVIRCVYEYAGFLREFSQGFRDVGHIYPDGVSVVSPVLTWSDDFSLSIAGVPSLVNDFAGGSFMETHYHSQFDNDDAYDPDIYRFHHELYGCLLLAFDRCLLPPLDFSPRLEALCNSLDREWSNSQQADELTKAVGQALRVAGRCRDRVGALNRRFASLAHRDAEAVRLWEDSRPLERELLAAFRFCEDAFVRLTWHDEVIFPHQYAQRNLTLLARAAEALTLGDRRGALEALAGIDANHYARFFSREVCRHFTDYALHQPAERLMWGAGRLPGHCELFEAVRALEENRADSSQILREIGQAQDAQRCLLAQSIRQETEDCRTLASLLERAEESRVFQ